MRANTLLVVRRWGFSLPKVNNAWYREGLPQGGSGWRRDWDHDSELQVVLRVQLGEWLQSGRVDEFMDAHFDEVASVCGLQWIVSTDQSLTMVKALTPADLRRGGVAIPVHDYCAKLGYPYDAVGVRS